MKPDKDVDADSTFIDLCGGPGAWSELVLRETPMTGVGFTLNAPMTAQGETWYARLAEGGRWKALWGADKTGNIYPPSNVQHVADELKVNSFFFNNCFVAHFLTFFSA